MIMRVSGVSKKERDMGVGLLCLGGGIFTKDIGKMTKCVGGVG